MDESSSQPASRTATQTAVALVLFLAVTFGVAWFGSQFMPGPWYQQLTKPSWTPPGWLFPPVWTFLYASMATAGWLVWKNHPLEVARPALYLFFGQLVLNGLWSLLFFGLHLIGVALLDIAVLLVLIVMTTVAFYRRHRLAGLLFIPYILWVSFATALNFRIWQLN